MDPFIAKFLFDSWLISARSDKPLFIQHCHAYIQDIQANVAVLYEQRFVDAGRNETAVKKLIWQ